MLSWAIVLPTPTKRVEPVVKPVSTGDTGKLAPDITFNWSTSSLFMVEVARPNTLIAGSTPFIIFGIMKETGGVVEETQACVVVAEVEIGKRNKVVIIVNSVFFMVFNKY